MFTWFKKYTRARVLAHTCTQTCATCTHMFTAAFFKIAKKWTPLQRVSGGGGINSRCCTYTTGEHSTAGADCRPALRREGTHEAGRGVQPPHPEAPVLYDIHMKCSEEANL